MVAFPCRVFILGGTRTPSVWPGHRYFPRRQGRWSADDQGQCACFLHLSSFDLVRATVHFLGSAITLVNATPMRFPYSMMCAAILGLFVVAHAISIHEVKLPSTQASTSAPSSTTRRSVPATTPPRPVSSSSPSPSPPGGPATRSVSRDPCQLHRRCHRRFESERVGLHLRWVL